MGTLAGVSASVRLPSGVVVDQEVKGLMLSDI